MAENPMTRKLQQLAQQIYNRDQTLPVLDRKEDAEAWKQWETWRVKNGMKIAFMQTRQRWTVPLKYPPVDIDASLAASRKSARRELAE